MIKKLQIFNANTLKILACVTNHSLLPKEYMFFALIPVALYNGTKGKWKMKYFFYFFYPLHILILQGISVALYYLF